MDRVSVTAAELLEALRSASAVDNAEGAMTCAEISEQTGRSRVYVQRMLRIAIKEGRVECVPRSITYIDGRQSSVPGYRVRST